MLLYILGLTYITPPYLGHIVAWETSNEDVSVVVRQTAGEPEKNQGCYIWW